jgi:hypothetical protein
MFCCHSEGCISLEGNFATKHLEENDAESVDIDAMIDWLTIDHLWSHVFRCT